MTTTALIDDERLQIAWCIQNPKEFWTLSDRMGPGTFRKQPWSLLWPVIYKAYQKHECFPSVEEVGGLLEGLELESATKFQFLGLLKSLYTVDVTAFSAAEVTKFVACGELERLAASLQETRTSKHDISEQVQFAKERLEKIELLAGGKKSFGSRFDPYKFEQWWVDIAEAYGGEPVTTGFYRLDQKLRGFGMRPIIALIVAPTGGMKTTTLCHMVHANCRLPRAFHQDPTVKPLGHRPVVFHSDDNKAEIMERYLAHVLQRPIRTEDWLEGNRERVAAEACARRNAEYFGEPDLHEIDPDCYKARDFVRLLQDLQSDYAAQDRRDIKDGYLIRPEEIGKIRMVGIDLADHVLPTHPTKDEWRNEERKFTDLKVITKRFLCPLVCTVQSNQSGVGAAQGTERNTGGGYGKLKTPKLSLFVAQTVEQSQSAKTLPYDHEKFVLNEKHLWAWNKQSDRLTEWEPLSLCIVKNTAANGEGGCGPVRKVTIPCLAHLGSSRLIEDYTQPDGLMRAPNETMREKKEAEAGPAQVPPERTGKKGPK